MENKENLYVIRELKTSSKGTSYEVLTINVNVNGKIYEIKNVFISDTEKALLDVAGVQYAKA